MERAGQDRRVTRQVETRSSGTRSTAATIAASAVQRVSAVLHCATTGLLEESHGLSYLKQN